MSTIYVNAAWTDEAAFNADSEKPEGLVWNSTAFATINGALEAVKTNRTDATERWTINLAAGEYSEFVDLNRKSEDDAKGDVFNNIDFVGETDGEELLVSLTGGMRIGCRWVKDENEEIIAGYESSMFSGINLTNIKFVGSSEIEAALVLSGAKDSIITNCDFVGGENYSSDTVLVKVPYGNAPTGTSTNTGGNGPQTFVKCDFTGGHISIAQSYGGGFDTCTFTNAMVDLGSGSERPFTECIFNNDISKMGAGYNGNIYCIRTCNQGDPINGCKFTIVGTGKPADGTVWTAIWARPVYESGRPNLEVEDSSFNISNSNIQAVHNLVWPFDKDGSAEKGNTSVELIGDTKATGSVTLEQLLASSKGSVELIETNADDEVVSTSTYKDGALESVVAADKVLYLNGESYTADLEYKAIKAASKTSKITDADVKVVGLQVGSYSADENITDSATLELSGVNVVISGEQGPDSSLWIGDTLSEADYKGTYKLVLKDGSTIRGVGSVDAVDGQAVQGAAIRKDGVLEITEGSSIYLANVPIRGEVIISDANSKLTVQSGNLYSSPGDVASSITVEEGGTFRVAHHSGSGPTASNTFSLGGGEDYSDYKGQINLYGGTLEIGERDIVKVYKGSTIEVNGGVIDGKENSVINLTNGGILKVTGSEASTVKATITGNALELSGTLDQSNVAGKIKVVGNGVIQDSTVGNVLVGIDQNFDDSTGYFEAGYSDKANTLTIKENVTSGRLYIGCDNDAAATAKVYIEKEANVNVTGSYIYASGELHVKGNITSSQDVSVGGKMYLTEGATWTQNWEGRITKDGVLSLNNSSATLAGSWYVGGYYESSTGGTIQLANGASIKFTGSELATRKDSNITINDSSFTAKVLKHSGDITMDADSLLTASSITGTGTITVNVAKDFSGIKKVIDITGDGDVVEVAVTGNAKAYAVTDGGDTYVTTADKTAIMLDATATDANFGTAIDADGKFIAGVNAFDSAAEAINAMTAATKTIYVNGTVEGQWPAKGITIDKDLKFEAVNGAPATIIANGGMYGAAISVNMTLGAGVTLNTAPDQKTQNFCGYGADGKDITLDINGIWQNGGGDFGSYAADATGTVAVKVGSTGKFISVGLDNTSFLANSIVNVTGTGNAKTKEKMEEIQFVSGVNTSMNGKVDMVNTNVLFGGYTPYGNLAFSGDDSMTVSNSIFTVVCNTVIGIDENGQAVYRNDDMNPEIVYGNLTINKNATFTDSELNVANLMIGGKTFTVNGGVINAHAAYWDDSVANGSNANKNWTGDITIAEGTTLAMTNATLNAEGTVTNNGTFTVSEKAEATLNISKLIGNAIVLENGATLVDSTVGGKVVAAGDSEIKDSTVSGVATGNNTITFSGDVNVVAGNVDVGGYTVDDDNKVWYDEAKLIVAGNVNTEASDGFYNKYQAEVVVNKGAVLTTSGKFQNNGDMTVYGKLNINKGGWEPKLAGTETATSSLGGSFTVDGSKGEGIVSVDAGWLTFGGGQGSVWAEATGNYSVNIVNGGRLTTTAAGFRNSAKSTLNLNKGTLEFTSPATVGWPTNVVVNNAGVINASNASTVDFGDRELVNDGSVSIDSSDFKAGSLTNSKDITLKGAATFDVDSFTNNGTLTLDGFNGNLTGVTKLENEAVTGNIEVYGKTVIKDSFDTALLSVGAKLAERKLGKDSLTIADGVTANMANLYVKASSSMNIAAGAVINVIGFYNKTDSFGGDGLFASYGTTNVDGTLNVRNNSGCGYNKIGYTSYANEDGVAVVNVNKGGVFNLNTIGADGAENSLVIDTDGTLNVNDGGTFNADDRATVVNNGKFNVKGAVNLNIVNFEGKAITVADKASINGNVSADLNLKGNITLNGKYTGNVTGNKNITVSNGLYQFQGTAEAKSVIKSIVTTNDSMVGFNFTNTTVGSVTLNGDFNMFIVAGGATVNNITIDGTVNYVPGLFMVQLGNTAITGKNNAELNISIGYNTFGGNTVKGVKLNLTNVNINAGINISIDNLANIKTINNYVVVGNSTVGYFFTDKNNTDDVKDDVVYEIVKDGSSVKFNEVKPSEGGEDIPATTIQDFNGSLNGMTEDFSVEAKAGTAKLSISKNESAKVNEITKDANGGVTNISLSSGADLTANAIYALGKLSTGTGAEVNLGLVDGTNLNTTISLGKDNQATIGAVDMKGGKNTLSIGARTDAEIKGAVDNVRTIKLASGKKDDLTSLIVEDTVNAPDMANSITLGNYASLELKKGLKNSDINVGTTIKVGKYSKIVASGDMTYVAGISIGAGSFFSAKDIIGTAGKNTFALGADMTGNGANKEVVIESVDMKGGKNTFSVGARTDVVINGDLSNVSTLKLANGTYYKKTKKNPTAYTNETSLAMQNFTGVNATVAIGNYASFSAANMTGVSKLTVGKNSKFTAAAITANEKNNTFSFNSNAVANVTSIDFGAGNDTLKLASGVKLTAETLIFGEGTKDKLAFSKNASLVLTGDISGLESITGNKSNTIYLTNGVKINGKDAADVEDVKGLNKVNVVEVFNNCNAGDIDETLSIYNTADIFELAVGQTLSVDKVDGGSIKISTWDDVKNDWTLLTSTTIPTGAIDGKVKVELGELEDDKIKYDISIA